MYLAKLSTKICELVGEDFVLEDKQRIGSWEKNKGRMIMDPANVAAIRPLNKKSFNFLKNRVKDDKNDWEIKSKLDTPKSKSKKIHSSQYSLEYLKKIMEILDYMNDTVMFSMSTNFPLKINVKNEDYGLEFDIFLAPRIEKD